MPFKSVDLNPFTQEQADIERKRRIAEALQAQALQPIEQQPTPAGGFAVPVSPIQGFAKVAQALAAGFGQRRADEQTKDLIQRFTQGKNAAVAQALDAGRGSPAVPESFIGEPGDELFTPAQAEVKPNFERTLQALAQSGFSDLQSGAMKQLGQIAVENAKPFNLGPEEERRGPNNELLARGAPRIRSITAAGPTGSPETRFAIPDVNAPPIPQPVQTQIGPAGQAFNPFELKPGSVLADPNKPFQATPGGGQAPNLPFQQFELNKAAANRPQVSVDNRAETAFGSAIGKGAAERVTAQFDTANSAVENVIKLNEVLNNLETSETITGLGADLLLDARRLQKLVTGSKAAGKVVSDTQLLNAFLGSDVFPLIKQLGIGARGLDTPAEREFLREVMTGTINLDKNTLIKMTQIRRDISLRAIDNFNSRVRSGELDEFFRLSRIPKRTIDVPQGGRTAPSGVRFLGFE